MRYTYASRLYWFVKTGMERHERHLSTEEVEPPDSTFPPPSVYDFTYAHSDWVDAITTQALRAAEGAFAPFPAIIVEFGTQTTTPRSFPGRSFRKLIGQRPGPAITLDQNHVALISGNIHPVYGGESFEGHSPSWVYYGTAMNAAQPFLQLTQQLPSDASQTMTADQKAAFDKLLDGLGKGIGNTAAHEIGHQFNLPYMDCDSPPNNSYEGQPAGPTCPGPGDHKLLYQYFKSEEPMFSKIGLPLHWSPEAEQCLQKKLLIPWEEPSHSCQEQ